MNNKEFTPTINRLRELLIELFGEGDLTEVVDLLTEIDSAMWNTSRNQNVYILLNAINNRANNIISLIQELLDNKCCATNSDTTNTTFTGNNIADLNSNIETWKNSNPNMIIDNLVIIPTETGCEALLISHEKTEPAE